MNTCTDCNELITSRGCGCNAKYSTERGFFTPAVTPEPSAPEPSERAQFEAWAEPILGDTWTWRESGDCELAWQAWQARAAPKPSPSPVVVEPTRAALTELVALKDLKEKIELGAHEPTDWPYYTDCFTDEAARRIAMSDYDNRKPRAWANARAALAVGTEIKHSESTVERKCLTPGAIYSIDTKTWSPCIDFSVTLLSQHQKLLVTEDLSKALEQAFHDAIEPILATIWAKKS